MTDHDHLMGQAREAWRAAAPSEQEIQLGAARVGRRLTRRTKSFGRRRILVSVGACAAFLAAIAYAGTQNWIALPHSPRMAPQPTAAPTAVEVREPLKSDAPSSIPRLAPSSLEIDEDRGASPPEAIHPQSTNALPAPESSIGARKPASPSDDVAKTPAAQKATSPSWAEVSDALSGGDEKNAQLLLSDLAHRGQSADDRAKAKLGLAQLEASHGNCAKARIFALQVAAVQGIELKTVRRALELAAHCTQ